MQKCGHLPSSSTIYRDYAEYGQYMDVRLAAMECLVDYLKVEGRWEDMEFLLKQLENDPNPEARHQIARLLVENSPFERNRSHRLNRHELRERIWRYMNFKLSHDTRLRCDMCDLYYALYGTKEPSAVKNPELASLYQPQRVEPELDDMKIELDDHLVDIKDIIPGPNIEGDFKSIEIETETFEEQREFKPELVEAEVMMITTQPDDLLMKVESEDFELAQTLTTIEPKIDAGEGSKKKIKLDYTSDNSQSQPSILDVNEFALEGGEVKEHGVKVI